MMHWIGIARTGLLLLIGAAVLLSRPAVGENCTLRQLAVFPITMSDMRPLMTAKVNDTDVRFMLDSGAFYSMLSPASAAELHLKTRSAPYGFHVTGVGGGRAEASIANVAVFTLAGAQFHDVEFLVGGSAVGSDNVGVLGQNVLHIGDVEYDLGQGEVRLFQTKGCQGPLAYWTGDAGTPFSAIDISGTTPLEPHTLATAYVNGKEIRVMFDSGAGLSTLSLRAAARLGITPQSPGVVSAGESYGIGEKIIQSYIAPIASFKLGDEEIRNTRLRIADLELLQADMLLGPDFFLSHRIYVSNRQHKLYFSYNGGPVFNLSGTKKPPESAPAAAANAPSGGDAGEAAGAVTANGAVGGGDAADFSRRGVAAASRRDFSAALTELTRACDLAPNNADYIFQRAMVNWQLQRTAAATADIDRALQLQPDLVPALMARAEWSLQSGDKSAAGRDLDAANAAASPLADVRLGMARAYLAADLLGPALAQLDLWVPAHAEDARVPEALDLRCRIRALSGSDLPLALKDCDAAVKRAVKSTESYARATDSRGLLRLRLGDYDRSIADFDASLKTEPSNAWAWYGRGLDKLHKHDTAGGQSDIERATALWPAVAEAFRGHGIVP